jgi:hypothetical protein
MFLNLLISIVFASAPVPGYFELAIQSIKPNYCPGNTISYKLLTSNPKTLDSTLGKSFITGQIRGARPGGPRGFIGPAEPSRQELSNFIGNQTIQYTIPSDYGGYMYWLEVYLDWENDQATTSNMASTVIKTETFKIDTCAAVTVTTNGPLATGVVSGALGMGSTMIYGMLLMFL